VGQERLIPLDQVAAVRSQVPGSDNLDELIRFVRLALIARGVDEELLTPYRLRKEAERLSNDLETNPSISATAVPQYSSVARTFAGTVLLRRTLADAGALDKPASFSFATFHRDDATVDGNARTQVAANAALIVKLQRWSLGRGRLTLTPMAGAEADLTTGLKKDADRLTVRIGGTITLQPADAGWADTFVVAYDHSTDRDFEADVRGLSVQYSLTQVHANFKDSATAGKITSIKWRPTAGYTWLDVKNTAGIPALAELKNADVWFAQAELEVAISRLEIKPLAQFGQRRGDVNTKFSLGQVVTSVRLSQDGSLVQLRLDLELSAGHRYPKFVREQKAKVALSVQFYPNPGAHLN
jgi:hypothetical protein